jgi:hypothetical protein
MPCAAGRQPLAHALSHSAVAGGNQIESVEATGWCRLMVLRVAQIPISLAGACRQARRETAAGDGSSGGCGRAARTARSNIREHGPTRAGRANCKCSRQAKCQGARWVRQRAVNVSVPPQSPREPEPGHRAPMVGAALVRPAPIG